jgi:hypothetical protein
MRIFDQPIYVFKSLTGERVALVEGGHFFREDGQFALADGRNETHGIWKSSFKVSEHLIIGNPVSPSGQVSQEVRSLKRSEWKCVFGLGSRTLSLHIPSIGPLDLKACEDSFVRAELFFRNHFPEFLFEGFDCVSWMLDPQFVHHLSASSNLIQFLKRFHLFPLRGTSENQTLERVFPFQDIASREWHRLVATTSLQKAIKAHLLSGGIWRSGACYLTLEDLPWGKEIAQF